VTGVHVPPRDPAALTAALVDLLGNPARRAMLGTAGAERAHRRYAWGHVARETMRVYEQLAQEQARGRPRARRAKAEAR
jgi:glycosyltransferase involved in cell wall biosynthesis